jgi:hypothetical protein
MTDPQPFRSQGSQRALAPFHTNLAGQTWKIMDMVWTPQK